MLPLHRVSRQHLARQAVLRRLTRRGVQSSRRLALAFWRCRLAAATARLRQQEREGGIGRGAVVAETALGRRDTSVEPDTATGSEVLLDTSDTATAAKAEVTTLAADLRTQPEPASSDEAKQEEGDPPLSETMTVAERVLHLEQKEETVRSRRGNENALAKAKASSRVCVVRSVCAGGQLL